NGPALPKVAMGHNLVILKKGVAALDFGVEIAPTANLTNDFLPDSAKEKVLVYSKLLGPGETDEILFTAPEPGEYDYMCTFTGHFVMMRGKLVVKE
ncbi:MAG: plastocyanin/azurin family copper-binding protein, partial [Verrucomicrobiota bacterium]|nr:plastocyanin/azurin family copper-binding protein [Verrucomicrobiota bacterium]